MMRTQKNTNLPNVTTIKEITSRHWRSLRIRFQSVGKTSFMALAKETVNSDLEFAFLLGSVECYLTIYEVQAFAAVSLFGLGEHLGSVLYYKKAVKLAKETLSLMDFDPFNSVEQKTKSKLERIVEVAEPRILLLGHTVKKSKPEKIRVKLRLDSHTVVAKRLRPYWAGMDAESKRNFMKVSTEKLSAYVERIYGREGQEALEQVLESARKNRKWKFWMCRSCSLKFFYLKKFKNHLEQVHAAKVKPSKEDMVHRVDEVWAGMISVVGWEPVDAVAAAEMIKNRLELVKEFVYENGWSKDWPLAADEERHKLLKEIQLLLVSFVKRKILSCSIRDWMMQFPVKHLVQFEVSEHTLTTECRLVETPQSICFLECHDLNQILDLLKRIKCERVDGTELVSSATDSLWVRTLVKEKIEFDHEFSFMLLDRRLLRGKISSFDDEGSIDVCDRNVHYAKTHPQGDDIITWLLDCTLIDKSFAFPESIRAHNLDIWVAVLRAVQFTCRTLKTKYANKWRILCYDSCLNHAKKLCIREDERRMNVPEDQWNKYASLLCKNCEELLTRDKGDPRVTELFLCAVRDVFQGASHPAFGFPNRECCLTLLHRHKNISDDMVLKSIDLLKSVVTNKGPVVDSKILLIENSRINLLNDLVRLSVFDFRSYILPLLKRFMREELDGIVDMDAKAKLAAVETELLFEEKIEKEKKEKKEKKSGPKKKKRRCNKRTSATMSCHLDQDVEHESSVNLESRVTSVKTAKEDSMKPEDTFSSQRGQFETSSNTNNRDHDVEHESSVNLESGVTSLKTAEEDTVSSNTNNQEEAIKDLRNMPREDSLSEAATRYRSALDMALKALLNIKVLQEDLVHNRQPFHGNLEEQVPYALQDFFSAFVSEQITEEGLYSYLLSNLLASLEEVHSMSSDAAEIVVAILEFCHFWKSPERESLVTRLFTLVEYERMSCRKCRRKPNYPEKSSYGIVMAANSIRDLKCALGNIKLEDILKIIRKEDKMLCDIRTGGCGVENIVHHILSRCPPIFTIVLQWEKTETEKEISETTKALDWEINISRLYEGLEEPNTKYRVVSMIGCGEEGNYICMAYRKNRWVSLRHEALAEEVVGNWKSLVRFCGEKKVRPEILFYEAFQWLNK